MENLCENLSKCLPSRDEEARNVIHRIAQFFQRELTSEERDFALHILFVEDKGLGSFVPSCISNKLFHRIISEVFLLLSYMVENYKNALDDYIVNVKNICISWLQNPVSADSKDKALDTLIVVIRSGPWSSDLNVQSLLSLLISKTPSTAKHESPTVLRKVYSLMGLITELYPHEVDQQSRSILRIFLKDLKYQTGSTSKVEFIVIEGCFEGLSGYLHSFSLGDQELCLELCTILKKVLLNHKSSRRTAHRAALNTLSKHGSQFASLLVNDFKQWSHILCPWLSYGKEERASAKLALLTFYKVVSSHIFSSGNEKDMLLFFINQFKGQFASLKDVDIAIKGFGLFAKACKLQMPEEIPVIFNLLAQRAEEAFEQENQHKLIDYLESLAALSVELGAIHSIHLSILEGLTVHLVTLYPHEDHPDWQAAIVNAIIITVLLLSRCSGMTVDLYLNTIVYQGLLRTVSHPVLQDVALLKESGQKVVTYENYLPLWQGLVTLNVSGRINPLNSVGIIEKKDVSTLMFDKIVYSIIEIIHKLDLSVKDNTESETVSLNDIEKCIEAVHPQDFTVLVNLVDFIIALLKDLPNSSYFDKWISPLILDAIKLSIKHPLVSSFYKFLANIVRVASQTGYFKQEDMEDIEWRTCMNLLSGYLYDVILRHSQYKGDLQVACLHLILAAPSNIASTLFPHITSACESVFRMGSSMLSLAQEGLRTLVTWNQEIPKEKMKPLFERVLPMFDRILQTRDSVGLDEDEDENGPVGMQTVKKVALLLKKNKKSRRHAVKIHTDTELGQLQTEIILFLSSLDSDIYSSILDKSEERSEVMSWQKEKFLEFSLPFSDMKLPMQFDDLMPRISDLALNCSDRQTRSSACELLHAIIMFMLGKEKQLESARQGQLTDIWKRLFPIIFRLACDTDLLINQLYKPLGEQLAHWYSSKMHLKSQQASAFLEALFSGIAHDTDAALRDYCSVCLHEYVKWSQKQGNVHGKVAPLLKQIVSLCRHPSSHKRMGAALAFNGMYRILREERKIVDEFWLELLHSFGSALSLCSITGEETQTEKQIEKSLQHLLRVFIECCNIFNSNSDQRRVPKDLTGSTLWHGVRWLLSLCTVLNFTCRRNARNLVQRLAPYVSGCRSVSDVFEKIKMEEGPEAPCRIVEGTHYHKFPLSDVNLSWDKVMKWVHALLASMEVCIWLMENDIPPTSLIDFENSSILKNIAVFLTKVIESPVLESSLWRPKAIENFSSSKCTCIIRMIEFLTLLLKKNLGKTLNCLWNNTMWEIITYCTLWPSHIGFDTSSRSVTENLPLVMRDFLKALNSHSDSEIVCSLKNNLKTHALQNTSELLSRFSTCVYEDKVEQRLRDLVEGLKTFHETFKDTEEWSGLTADSIQNTIFSGIVREVINNDSKAPVTLGPSATVYAEKLLSLCFCLSNGIKAVIFLTCDSTPLHRPALQGHLSHGEHFVITFKSVLTQRLIQLPVECIGSILEFLSNDTTPQNLTILPALLKVDLRSAPETRNNLKKLVSALLSHWNAFAEWAKNNSEREMWMISILSHIVRLDLPSMNYSPFKVAQSWILERLESPSFPLQFKVNLISLLPLLSSCGETSNNEVKSALNAFKERHIPLYSSELKNNDQSHYLVRASEELLKSAQISGSIVILETVIKFMVVNEHHPCLNILSKSLEAFMNRLKGNSDHQCTSLFVVFDMFAHETRNIDQRLRILNSFLLPLIKSASMNALNIFAEQVICRLINIVANPILNRGVSRTKTMQCFVSHIGSWNLLQHIFGFSSRSRLEEKGSELVKAALREKSVEINTGKELVCFLTKTATDCMKSFIPAAEEDSNEYREIQRLYFCAIYNMLATLLCNLKTSASDLKFYERLLFTESKNMYIWRNIVDNSKRYIEPYERSSNLKSMKQLVTIRRELHRERKDMNSSFAQSLELLSSQSAAFAGTLEADITRFDFTHSSVLAAPLPHETEMEVDSVVLESDDLNNHECMAMLCAVLRHMVDSKITPVPDTSDGVHPYLPQWMQSLQTSMLDSTCPRNACIFLLRLILNCESYFYPYAFHWMVPALQCVSKHCLESHISYLLGDLVCLFVKWSAIAPPSESHRDPINSILRFLVANSYHMEREAFRFHLELVRSIVDVWKQIINPPVDLLCSFLVHSDIRIGIHMIAIMLFNDIAPWTGENKQDFFKFLLKGLQENKKALYKSSAETVGLCFKYICKHSNEELLEEDKAFVDAVMDYAKHVHYKQSDVDRFLTIVYAVHDQVPNKIDSVIPVLLFYLAQTTGDTRALCLTLVASRLEYFGGDAFKEMKDQGIESMLLDRDVNVQTKALQVLHKLAPTLSETDLLEVTQMISVVPQLESKDARQIAYDIALASYDQLLLKKANDEMLSEREQVILTDSKAILLWGLVDKNPDVQRKLFSLWCKERIPIRASQRLFALLEGFYSPLTEEHFLAYGVELMMEGTKSTPDYNSMVFEHGLEECDFEDYNIVSSWRAKHASMAPMFAQTFASQMNKSESLNASFSDASGLILATQNSLLFQPTPSSFVDESDSPLYTTNEESIVKSSLMFSSTSQMSGTQNLSRTSRDYKQGPDFGSRRLRYSMNADSVTEKESNLAFRSQRYLGRQKASDVFSLVNIRRTKKREELRKERARKREGQVSVYRKYRRGDFPDIQVKTSDFIIPLKEVAKRDSHVARRVLVSLFSGVKQKLTFEEERHFIEEVSSVVGKILESSKRNETSMVGALLDIAYEYKLQLDPKVVSSASKKSGLLSLGALFLESQVGRSNCGDAQKNIWLSVAELYDALGEKDVAHAVLLNHIEVGEVAKEALCAHAEEDWHTAKRKYYQALLATRVDNFYESYFECMVRLSDWKGVNRIVRDQVDGKVDKLWEEIWHEEKLLPRLIHSEVLQIIEDNRDERNFMRDINRWFKDEEKSPILKDKFCESLSVLFLIKKNIPHARYYAKKSLAKFIDDWSELNPLSVKQRELVLIAVQPVGEILVFLNDLNAAAFLQNDASVILKKLETILPAPHDSLTGWETRISYRTAFLKHFPESLATETKKVFVGMHLSLAECALQQKNMIFAKKYIDILKRTIEDCDGVVRTRWLIARCQERHLWAKSQLVGAVQCLSNYLKIWKVLDCVMGHHDLDHTPKLSISAHSTESNLCGSVKLLLSQHQESWDDLTRRDEASASWLSTKLQLQSPTTNEIIQALDRLGWKSLVHSKNMIKICYNENDNYSDQVADAYVCIAQYCRNTLESSSSDSSAHVLLSTSFVQAILSAMRYGSSIARQLFPLLLHLPNLSTDLAEEFKTRSDRVPEWMFLSWIPQLLAVLDSQLGSVVLPLLLRLAEKFPNAVVYPYNISREKYKEDHVVNETVTCSLQKLDSILKTNPLQMLFIRSLSCLCHPTVILNHYLKDVNTVLGKNQIDWSLIIKTCRIIFFDVLQEDPDSGLQQGDLGALFKEVSRRDFRESLRALYKAAGQRNKEKAKSSCEVLVKLLSRIKERDDNLNRTLKLKDFSPWLSQFSASKFDFDIEIPGQYTGERKPFPDRHIRISSFVENVQVMPSIRRPVKLTVIGSDAHHYDFLLKFGEDLRQDERVQQLFKLMNSVFRNNPHCWNRRLSIATYKVMPLSNRLGFIEWVNDTTSLKDLFESALSEKEMENWSKTYSQHKDLFEKYRSSLYNVYNRDESVKQFSELASSIPLDVLRRGFAQRSSSAEAFYTLRHTFITSYSTMCIAHWLIGVGDRHLSNCMMSLKSGQCVGIDFGHTFGTATQFLPLPELVPFRLTPHIVGLMAPFNKIGLIEETMVHCLRALRTDSELLVATMQVFIFEPTLDWLQFSQKAIHEGKLGLDNCAWLPTTKIHQVRRKLEGVNPIVIMEEDLQNGHSHRKETFKALCSILRGDAETSIRSSHSNEGLSARQQIESLIDLATDCEVLFKTFHGWLPWA